MKKQEEESYNNQVTIIYPYQLPYKKIPSEFAHKATGKSITIPLAPGTLSASSRFKACFLILPFKCHEYHYISCSVRSKGGVTVHSSGFWAQLSDRSKHLFIFHGDLFRQRNRCHEVDVSENIFEFGCKDNDDKIVECGVQILSEETESNSGCEVDYFETGGIIDDHTDGDEYYKLEAQCKYTSWSWLKKFWLDERYDDEEEGNMTPHYDSKMMMMMKVFALSISLLLVYVVFS